MDSWPSTVGIFADIQHASDDERFNTILARYRPHIVRLCQRKYGQQNCDADEIAQHVLIKLFKCLQESEIETDRSLRAWLKTVARNAVIDVVRKETTRANAIRQLAEDQIDAFAEDISETMSSTLQEELLQQGEIIAKERVQEHVFQCYLERETPAGELSSKLNMTIDAVYAARYRVIQLIKEDYS